MAARRNLSRPWLDWEVDRLLFLWRSGLPVSAIAQRLGRSNSSVASKLNALRRAGVGMLCMNLMDEMGRDRYRTKVKI